VHGAWFNRVSTTPAPPPGRSGAKKKDATGQPFTRQQNSGGRVQRPLDAAAVESKSHRAGVAFAAVLVGNQSTGSHVSNTTKIGESLQPAVGQNKPSGFNSMDVSLAER
jgi:hypothetical protein